MALRSRLLAGSLSFTALASACSGGERVVMQWTGADTGQASLSATAMRCGGGIQLFATSGDTGVALLLFPGSKQRGKADLPVLSPADARETRPAAAIAARWLDSARVDGYRSEKGRVQLSSIKGTLDGEFRSVLRREGDQAQVTLSGRIRGVPIGACTDSAG